jgi:hypothetical protein
MRMAVTPRRMCNKLARDAAAGHGFRGEPLRASEGAVRVGVRAGGTPDVERNRRCAAVRVPRGSRMHAVAVRHQFVAGCAAAISVAP